MAGYALALSSVLLSMVALPAAGALLAGHSLSEYLEFPPLTAPASHSPFSWPVFILMAAVEIASLILIAGCLTPSDGDKNTCKVRGGRFPWWGWLGLLLAGAGWWLAWTRHSWFSAFQRHSFCLPWAGYILAVNGWCEKRASISWFRLCPGRFGLLFVVSSVFWWFFEFMNRFVRNWYYLGVEIFSPARYVMFASLAFATVLPAVVSTCLLLTTFRPFAISAANRLQVKTGNAGYIGLSALCVSALILILLGQYPDRLFPFVWIAPLVLICSVQALFGRQTVFAPLSRGDWRPLVVPATAALICGIFWEMWNYHSLARWVYCIAYVDRWHIFAMPLAGYGGYLPFGVECWAVACMVLGRQADFGLLAAKAFRPEKSAAAGFR